MDWQRVVLGSPGKGLGKGRWLLTTSIALVAGGYAAYLGDWQLAGLMFAVALVFGAISLWSYR